ncbi:MAG: hypothetical protein ABIG63_09920 [Chloroflexota bacterium]
MKTYQITQGQLDDAAQKNQSYLYPGVTGPGTYTYSENDNLYSPVAAPQITEENPHDFSASGLGIGGLGSHVEQLPIPTVAQIARLEQIEQQVKYCRRCGDNDGPYGDARFGNGGGNVCDDCF